MIWQGNKMDIKTKAEIIVQFTEELKDKKEFQDFFQYHDLGVPLAICVVKGFAELTDLGYEEVLYETYVDICDIYGADENKDYEDLDDLISG